METITPTNLRKDMFKVLKEVANTNSEIEVTMNSKNGLNDGIVLISKREWQAIQEELYLQRTGTLDYVFNQMETAEDDDFEVV
ncbi:type II toxin-antitoxin system Phd/YefM family antitoxin [Enterococcus faecalis]|uniref:Antitoxin n=1 Tax=Enterococcus faecalis ATCC 6055 TaxID=1169311 RepID=R3K123_ENTFL|nr:type II toxin-antitoxin system prevent-host-death family antitoxin [Enterococcus faecalis]EOK07275.1 prevent-host-death family protein [Enterococcus faecalis ATCC 6055]